MKDRELARITLVTYTYADDAEQVACELSEAWGGSDVGQFKEGGPTVEILNLPDVPAKVLDWFQSEQEATV